MPEYHFPCLLVKLWKRISLLLFKLLMQIFEFSCTLVIPPGEVNDWLCCDLMLAQLVLGVVFDVMLF